jgi:hypothetical protein
MQILSSFAVSTGTLLLSPSHYYLGATFLDAVLPVESHLFIYLSASPSVQESEENEENMKNVRSECQRVVLSLVVV